MHIEPPDYLKIINNSPSVMFIWNDVIGGPISYVSENISQFGYTQEDFMIKGLLWPDIVHEDDCAKAESETREFRRENKDTVVIHYRIITKSGEVRWILDCTWQELDELGDQKYYCGFVTDFTELFETQQRLRDSEERFRVVAENVSDIIYEYSVEDHYVQWFGGNLLNLLKITPEEIPKSVHEFLRFVHPKDLPQVLKQIDTAAKSKTHDRFNYRIIRKDGKIAYFQDSLEIIRDPSGKALKIVGTLSDLTYQKRIESELEIRQRMDYLGNLTAGLAHDFNNILTIIMGNLSLLNNDAELFTEDHNEMLGEIYTASQRGKEVIKQLQHFSTQESTTSEVVDVALVVDEVIKFLKSTTNNLVNKENLIPLKTYYLNGNASELNQVLLNLGTNSIYAIEEKESVSSADFIRIYASKPEDEEKKGTHIILHFQDSGNGIEDSLLPKIFNPFFTTKTGSGRNHVNGRGLGLSMVYNIITKKFKGSIDVESIINQGTIFHLTLPLHIEKKY